MNREDRIALLLKIATGTARVSDLVQKNYTWRVPCGDEPGKLFINGIQTEDERDIEAYRNFISNYKGKIKVNII